MRSKSANAPERACGFERFRGRQETITEHAVGGATRVPMPAGGGGSLRGVAPSLVQDSVDAQRLRRYRGTLPEVNRARA